MRLILPLLMSPKPIRRVVSKGKKISKSGLVQGRTTCTPYNRYFCLPNDLYEEQSDFRGNFMNRIESFVR